MTQEPLPAEQPTMSVEKPVEASTPKRRWFWQKEKRPPRPLLLRLFGLSLWGAIKLALLCILVGFFVLAAEFDPREPDVNVPAAIAALARSTMQAAGWAATNFWKPALAGASVVLPFWVLWRLATLPFRR